MLIAGRYAGFAHWLKGRWAGWRRTGPGCGRAAAAEEIRVLVIQARAAYRRGVSEAVRDADPGIRLRFTSGLGEVAGELAAGLFDVVVLDVERCLPAQLFWRLNPRRWDLPVMVLHNGSRPHPGRLQRDLFEGEQLCRALRMAAGSVAERARSAGPAAGDAGTARLAAALAKRFGEAIRQLAFGAVPLRV